MLENKLMIYILIASILSFYLLFIPKPSCSLGLNSKQIWKLESFKFDTQEVIDSTQDKRYDHLNLAEACQE